jgi:amino acid adenylation domain-containing protein/non-ribosomal peptide synthase protein (TIGR01720 family)
MTERMSDSLIATWQSLPKEKRKAFAALLRKRGIDVYKQLPVEPVSRTEALPLSFAQERMWFLAQLEPDSPAYNIAGACVLQGQLSAACLQQAVDVLVARHEPLRTAFVERAGRAEQHIVAAARCVVESVECEEAALPARVQAHAAQPFDLSCAPLLRVLLVRLGDERHALALSLHHIIADAWSLELLLDELMRLYDGFAHAVPVAQPALPLQYVDFAAWQRAWLSSGELERQLTYWRAQLGDEQPLLELPCDRAAVGGKPATLSGAVHVFRIDPQLSAAAQRLAQAEQATLFMLLLASFQLLLSRWTGQHDVRVGVPVTNRSRVEFEPMLGLFVNTQVQRAQLHGGLSFQALLTQVREAALAAQANAELPFERLVEALAPERDLGRSPLFQVLFNHEAKALRRSAASLGALHIEPLPPAERPIQFELVFESSLDDATGEIVGTLSYASNLFSQQAMERLAERYASILREVIADPQRRIGELSWLSADERAQLLAAGRGQSATEHDFAHVRIAEQARARPDAIALEAESGAQLTYRELDQLTSRWAQRLAAAGVGPEQRVGLCTGRGLNMVVAALAVWKVGGAYVALDPSQPIARLRALVQDAGVQVLLAERTQPAAAELAVTSTFWLDADDVSAELAEPPRVAHSARNLAYIVYTSGSTGEPKGVGVEHRALAQHLAAISADYGMQPDDCALHFLAMSFDVGVEQWARPLSCGAKLFIRGDELWSAERALELLRAHEVTWLDAPQAYVRELAQVALTRGERLQLRGCAVGGEALSAESLASIARAIAPAQLINAYGPTEVVITPMTWHAGAAARCSTAYAPIGRVVGPRMSYVLDAEQNLVPDGTVGELYLGGVCLARGYERRPGATAERFLPDPYASEPGARMYRTGDRVRRLPDGSVEYLGRADFQIKLRGYRIEPGEIEAKLSELGGVREAVVLLRGTGAAARLVAYIAGTADADSLRQQLRAAVPEHMVPSQLLVLAELPRNANGKVDRKRLPEPEAAARVYVAPRNAAERALCDIWQDVLGIAEVSVTSNFFELGGDSIVSIQVVSRARQAGLAITPRDIFQHQTVETLAAHAGRVLVAIPQGPELGPAPLLPIQAELLAASGAPPDHFNQAVLLRSATALDVPRLERALRTLCEHHDALRLRFQRAADGGWSQTYAASTELASSLWVERARDASEVEALCERAQRSLSIARGELLRAVYIAVADGSSRLLLTVHHLVVDGVSFRVLLEDLERAYAGQPLPPKTSSLGAFSHALRAYAQGPELAYWQTALAGQAAALPSLPDAASGKEQRTLRLDRATTSQLLKQAPAAYRTHIQDLLLCALARSVHSELQLSAALVMLESHGRADLFDALDVSRTVGWFTSKYPVRLDARGELPAAIKRVKERLRAIPQHGIGHGVLTNFGDADTRAALAALPQPQIVFNYLGQFDASFEAAGTFAVAEEAHGTVAAAGVGFDYPIEINGQVYGGELDFSIELSRAHVTPETATRFVDSFERELRALIAHCATANAFGRTPSDFPLARLTQAQLDPILGAAPGPEDIYPLTPMQRGMLFHTLYAPEQGTYLMQLDVGVRGLDPERFFRAWQVVLDRHAILRTSFVWRGLPEPLQRVAAQLPLSAESLDLRDAADVPAAVAALKQREHARGFELENAPLFRVVLARTAAERFHLVWTCHHLLLDGWSSARLLDEVLLSYLGRELPAPAGQFSDYLRYLAARPDSGETFWRERLERLSGPSLLAGSLPPALGPAAPQRVLTQLSAADTAALSAFAQRERVTANTLVQAAWTLILQRYTSQRSVVFGATVAGRPAALPGSEQMLGLFINTLAVIAAPEPEWTVRDMLQGMQSESLLAREYEHTPLSDVQRWAGRGGRGLFDTLLVFENYPIDKALASGWDGLEFEQVHAQDATNYPLSIAVNLGERLEITYNFSSAEFLPALIERIGAQLLALLQSFAQEPEQRVGSLALLGNPAAQQLLAAVGGGDQELFLDRALSAHAAGPLRDHPAVITAHERLSYRQLDQAANRLAQQLLRLGVVSDRVVGICMSRCASLLVSALAVWKAGAAFLPLDPRAPADRLRFMIEDAGAMLVLVNESSEALLDGVRTLRVPRADVYAEPVAAPELPRSGEHLAYVIYTSGSTGTPKGVAVSHRAASEHCRAAADIYQMRPSDCALHFASFTFDASVEQWLAPALGGATVRLSDDELWTPEELEQVIERDHVTIIYPPMSHVLGLAQLLEARGQRRPGLRVICVGGEAVPKSTIELLRRRLSPQLIVNGYGPTETVVTPLLWPATADMPCETAYAPIGRVVGDRACYVLDADLNILPAGAIGELYIAGSLCARGYHGRPGLTAERFVADPFTGRAGARMYRTGDLVRMRDDGMIEYLSRTDHQVKLRGYRIELGEIEAALLDQPGVAEAHVMVHEQGQSKALVAYVAGSFSAGAGEVAQRLIAALRERLPEHMLPQHVSVLPALPRTRHGKVDRTRLPAPEQAARAYEPPQGEVETLLAQLWAEILKVERIGRDDNFFELGGDSILSILVVSRVRERGYAITPRQLFAHPQLSALASVLERAPSAGPDVEIEPAQGEVPLTPIQHVFFAGQQHERHHFNLSVLLHAKRALDPVVLDVALQALVAHHSALRYRYAFEGEHIRQYYDAQLPERLVETQHVTPEQITAACQRAQRSLDLERGPLLRALHLVVSDGSERLLLAVHHLVSDAVSFRFLLEDLQSAYAQLQQGQPVRLPASSVSFKRWAERLEQHAASDACARELEHWERALSDAADLPQTPSAETGMDSCSFELDPTVTRTLLTAAPAAHAAQVQDVILAGLARALTHWTGRAAHSVELESHGRDASFEDVDATRCVGWFTTTYPLRLEAAASSGETVGNIKRHREALPDAGIGYGVLRELAPEPLRARMRRLARPRITFNYLGQFDASFEEDALLSPASEASGDEASAAAAAVNWLQIDAQVFRERFECTLQFQRERFASADMSALMQTFRNELQALAEQASKLSAHVELATSDIPRDGREADDMALKPRQYSASPVVQLASGQLAPPLFCLHPAGGVVFDYHILAKRVAGRRNVYGIQCRTLIDPSFRDDSIEDMAGAYARLITQTQPEGPYYLLGWSFGADLAIETAYVLEQMGQRVAFLGLVDRLIQDDPVIAAEQEAENDLLNMACNLLAARYPTFSRKELLLEAHGGRKRGVPDREIVRGLVGRVTGASADAQEEFDLEGLFVMHDVLRNMFRISEQFALKQLHVAPHCWWSADAQASKARGVAELEQGLGQVSAAAIDVESNHLQIVYDARFVETLGEVLEGLEAG